MIPVVDGGDPLPYPFPSAVINASWKWLGLRAHHTNDSQPKEKTIAVELRKLMVPKPELTKASNACEIIHVSAWLCHIYIYIYIYKYMYMHMYMFCKHKQTN